MGHGDVALSGAMEPLDRAEHGRVHCIIKGVHWHCSGAMLCTVVSMARLKCVQGH
ncbi:hypothetical protein LguiB_027349 [Lonicera macranthoides]